jgi:hypothetical protein
MDERISKAIRHSIKGAREQVLLSVPVKVREHMKGLAPGDYVRWQPQPDGSVLLSPIKTLAEAGS